MRSLEGWALCDPCRAAATRKGTLLPCWAGPHWLMALPLETAQVRSAWASLAGLDELRDLQVVVDAGSALCPRGWVGLLSLDGTVTAVVPDAAQVPMARAALAGLTPAQVTTAEVVVPRFGGVAELLGPAALFYATAPLVASTRVRQHVDRAEPDELGDLLHDAGAEDANESGLSDISALAFVDPRPGCHRRRVRVASLAGPHRPPLCPHPAGLPAAGTGPSRGGAGYRRGGSRRAPAPVASEADRVTAPGGAPRSGTARRPAQHEAWLMSVARWQVRLVEGTHAHVARAPTTLKPFASLPSVVMEGADVPLTLSVQRLGLAQRSWHLPGQKW